MTAERSGVVLVIALLALVAIEAIALGVVFLATQETAVAAAHDRALRARLAAEAAAAAVLANWRSAPVAPSCIGVGADTLPIVVHEVTDDGFRADARIEALAGRWLVARASAADAAGVRFRTALAFATADPDSLFTAFPAAISGTASGAGVLEEPPPAPAAAAAGAQALAGRADRSIAGDVRIGAVADGDRCRFAAPLNWGEPADRAHPCSTLQPLVHVAGQARVQGGAGQGVLVVTGGLVLGAGSRFDGAILITGELVIEAGATVSGAVTVAEGAVARIDAPVTDSPCAVLRALLGSGAAAALAPLAPPPHWLPLF